MIAEYYDLILPYYVLVLSAVSFIVTAVDKALSKTDMRRVPEKRFVLLSLLGGGLGVLSAFYLIRHKTKHGGLLAKVWVSSLLSYLILVSVSVLLRMYNI